MYKKSNADTRILDKLEDDLGESRNRREWRCRLVSVV